MPSSASHKKSRGDEWSEILDLQWIGGTEISGEILFLLDGLAKWRKRYVSMNSAFERDDVELFDLKCGQTLGLVTGVVVRESNLQREDLLDSK